MNKIITIFLFTTQITCINIKLSLLQKKDDTSNSYPVVMTIKENVNEENNKNIDFLCILDYLAENTEHNEYTFFQNLMESFIKNLTVNDKLTFITYKDKNRDEIFNFVDGRKQHDYFQNKRIKHLNLDFQNNKTDTKFCNYINTIETSDFFKIIFLFSRNNTKKYYNDILEKVIKFLDDFKNDYSLYLFSIDYESYPDNFSIFSDSRNIAFIPINNKENSNELNFTEYAQNIIKDIRNIKYKFNNITITSKYKIEKFYGKDDLEKHVRDKYGNFIYSFVKYQIIPDKEYTYFFNVILPEKIKYGDRILYVKIDYTNLNGMPNNISSSSLKFYNAINYFKVKKNEFCRVLLIETLEGYLIEDNNYLNINILKEKLNIINDDFCGQNFSKDYLNIESIQINDKKKNTNEYNKTIKHNFYYINNVLRNLSKK